MPSDTAVLDPPTMAAKLVPLPGSRPQVRGPVQGKLYIQTHGCQMNVYDSSRRPTAPKTLM